MSLQNLTIALLCLAIALASWRLLRQLRNNDAASRPRTWRIIALLLMQTASAVLLYFTLHPPASRSAADVLVMMTANARAEQITRLDPQARIVALPEAGTNAHAERVPDLASALRRYPATSRLRVLGTGLPARDLEAVQGFSVDFDPTPLPRGIVELHSPQNVYRGERWQVTGRAAQVPGGSVELLDPGQRTVARVALDKDGRFALDADARMPGTAMFRLRLLDAKQHRIEEIDLPLLTRESASPRVLVLAGGANPELKYLRRWALDAGARLHTQITLGAGMQMGDAPIALDAANLRQFDLLILDERAWRSLDTNQKTALTQALRQGLGVLLRLTGSLTDRDRNELRTLGFTIDVANVVQTVTLASGNSATETDTFSSAAKSGSENPQTDAPEKLPALSRQPLRVTAADASALLRDDTGAPLALWRAEGQGRLALWWLTDSYRLVLAGHRSAHGSTWSHAFNTLARTRGEREPTLANTDPRMHQRQVLCGIANDAQVIAPSGASTALLIDPATSRAACASYWPRESGWHVLRSGPTHWPFYIRNTTEAPGLTANAAREATLQLAATPAKPNTIERTSSNPGSPWPYFFAWLLLSAGMWWFERARIGQMREVVSGG